MSRSKNPTTVDRISDLPDEILCHILSFLPTKEAFTTILLSKRWNPLCYSLTTLWFEKHISLHLSPQDQSHSTFLFLRFIDTLMLSPRFKNQSLKTFRLKGRFEISDSNFYAWIEAAKQRRIEEFELESKYFYSTLNPTFLICQTLVVLKLERLKFKYEIFCADLPLLKTLHLKDLRFEYQNDVKKLLNACPNLQDFHSYYIRSKKNIEAEEFKSLFLSKLVRADIRFIAYNRSIDVPFNAIHNVAFLHLLWRHVASFQMNMEEIFKRIPVFQNLIHVELNSSDGIVEFLRHCPKLRILYIRKELNTSLSKDWECPISSLECVSSHLRSCTILEFEGSKNDLRFVTYILQNARVLEVMKIDFPISSSDEIQKRQIREELSTCSRISPGCKLCI